MVEGQYQRRVSVEYHDELVVPRRKSVSRGNGEYHRILQGGHAPEQVQPYFQSVRGCVGCWLKVNIFME